MDWDGEEQDEALAEYDADSWSIWNEFKYSARHWTRIYELYWGVRRDSAPEDVTEESWEHRRQEYRLANSLLKMIRVLSFEGAADNSEPMRVSGEILQPLRLELRRRGQSSIVKDRISLELAAEFVAQMSNATDRALRLLGILMARGLSERASVYVSRASRLYIQGLDIETAVMCRSALEAALTERLESSINMDSEPPSLMRMIQIAGENAMLDGLMSTPQSKRGWTGRTNSGIWRALRIVRAGNHIVHELPEYPAESGALQNSFEAVRELSLVVGELFPPPEY